MSQIQKAFIAALITATFVYSIASLLGAEVLFSVIAALFLLFIVMPSNDDDDDNNKKRFA